jgi:serine protease Do
MQECTGEVTLKKKIIITAIMFLCFAGVVSASSLNGDYKGNPIVLVKSNGKTLTDEVPAQIIDGKAMVPLTMLRNLGFDVTWNQNEYSVSVESASAPVSQVDTGLKKLTAKEISHFSDRVGVITTYDQNWHPLSQGSGFVIGNTGYVVTNSHVIGNASNWKFEIDGKTYFTSWYVFNDQTSDLYGFMADADAKTGVANPNANFKYIGLNFDLPEVGDKVYAIGSPQGLENTISDGIVSGIRKSNGMTYIQHTANTDHGSSGGVLLNEYGQVIGITSSGFDGTNLDFAIPTSYLQTHILMK